MTSRTVLGWRIPRQEREAFKEFVHGKWGTTDSYVRFEIESAMQEYLDQDDDLHQAEHLLRGLVDSSRLSSSSAVVSEERADHSDTVKLGYRVNEDLKDDFAAFAKQHYDENLGAVLARALNSYRGGGRRKRVLDLVQELATGGSAGDTTAESDENSGSIHTARDEPGDTTTPSDESRSGQQPAKISEGDTTAESDENPGVDATVVDEIATELAEQFTRGDLEKRVAATVDGRAPTIEAYSEAVIAYRNVVEHPTNDDLLIPESVREEMVVYDDLDREGRAEHLRVLVAREALKNRTKTHSVTYTDVQGLFEEDLGTAPSHDYAYTLMDDAAEEWGFTYTKKHGHYRLRASILDISMRVTEKAADHPDVDVSVGTDPARLDLAETGPVDPETIDVTTYAAGEPPTQEAGADD